MTPLQHVPIASFPPERFRALLGDSWGEVEAAMREAREVFAGRVVWHINSTAKGGGVVELLTSLLAYARGAGVDTRWAVINGDPAFFRITKRIHNHLHGSLGDGGALGAAERASYESTCAANARELHPLVRPDDVVFLHDPQTAGMIGPLRDTGARIVWRCHVGLDLPNDEARAAWDFLRPYVERADAYVFSRSEYVWDELDPDRAWIVAPSIDAFSPKNQELEAGAVSGILAVSGLLDAPANHPVFRRQDGSPGRVDRRAEAVGGAIPATATVVAQVSRWDRLKDPSGVLRCFAEQIGDPDVHLLLAGPEMEAVADDPEGPAVFGEVRAQREALAPEIARRAHLACLPMKDFEENAAIVNAIQRRADVVVQKSIAEGFGLTVAEAMWKARPVVASARGGINDMIVDGTSGVLIDDPLDLEALGSAIRALIADRSRRDALGAAARERIREHFLGTRHLIDYLHQIARLLR